MRRQIETPAFRAWFQDSKVVGASGNPLVVYHGTQSHFNTFAANERGIFFAEDAVLAGSFSRIRTGEPRIICAFLSIQNPWTVVRYSLDFPFSWKVDQSPMALSEKGYDGMHDPDDGVWIAFRPEQIKSATDTATDNNGLFERGSPDIRFSRQTPEHQR